ncbi:hypothetical protein AID14_22920, partial [Salmonella enterica subsp. enterica]|nr:hypothetical protein [Salmonella enterica subsp. enterica]
MIITDQMFSCTGAASAGTPSPATPKFYRPAEERGIWQLSYEGTGRKVNWQFTGNRKNYGFYT